MEKKTPARLELCQSAPNGPEARFIGLLGAEAVSEPWRIACSPPTATITRIQMMSCRVPLRSCRQRRYRK